MYYNRCVNIKKLKRLKSNSHRGHICTQGMNKKDNNALDERATRMSLRFISKYLFFNLFITYALLLLLHLRMILIHYIIIIKIQ